MNIRKWLIGTLIKETRRYFDNSRSWAIDYSSDKTGESYINGFDDRRIIILEAIEEVELTEEQRLIVDYVAFYKFSYSNVGEIMGYPRRKVGFLYTYAVKKILGELRRRGIKNTEDLL